MEILVNGEIVLYGTVGDSFWSDGFTDRDVIMALSELHDQDEIVVRINSGGGEAYMGIAIYNALKSCPATITIYVDGLAASAASVIAMAADRLVMNDGSMMMIHDPAGITFGDAADHEKTRESLNKLGDQAARIYSQKSGIEVDQIREMMREETWLTSDEAVENGFADESNSEVQASDATLFDYRVYANAPEELVSMATMHATRIKKTPLPTNERKDKMPENPESKAGQTPPANAEQTTQADENTDVVETKPDDVMNVDAGAKERERIAAITTCDESGGRSDLAAHLAFQTDLSVEKAIGILNASPKKETSTSAPKDAPAASPKQQIVEPLETMEGKPFQAAAPKLDPNKIYNRMNGVTQ